MEIELAYGEGTRRLSLKNGASVVRCPHVPGLKDPGEALLEGLDRPIGSASLRERLRKGKVVIVTSDKTRLVRYPLFLHHLLDYLNRAGFGDDRITLLIGLGTHEGHSLDELKALFGEAVMARVEIMEHNCHDRAEMITVGKTRFGNPVLLNRRVVEAENVILTGAIRFHLYSGFSGGRKAILPGVAAFETIQNNHRMTFTSSRCGLGILEENPVHQEMLDAARLLDPCFLVNVVCNESLEIVRFFTGHWQRAHEEGCQFAREIFSPRVKGQVDLAIASVGGYPDDINFYQAVKALDNTSGTVRDGGVMLLLAECRDGLGPEEFTQWFNGADTKTLTSRLKKEFSIPGYITLCFRKIAERIHVILVSSLPSDVVWKVAMIPAETPEDGLQQALRLLPPDFGTYVFPLAGIHLPLLG